MKKVVVLGASGGMGYALVKELSDRGIEVVAFARNEQKLKSLFDKDSNVVIFPGDAFTKEDLQAASQGVDVIFHAINIPYGDWKMKLLPLTKTIITAAKEAAAKLVVVDNVYAYGVNSEVVNEDIPKKPNTKKGKLRLHMSRLIEESDTPYMLVHFPDFYGPYVENGQLNYTLRQIVANKRAGIIGKQHIAREHIYTPDGARAMVELSLREDTYGQSWNIPATEIITGREVIQLIRELTGYRKQVYTITKNMIRMVGLVDKQMREFAEMQYLNEDPVVLDGSKYEKFIGPIPRTPYQEGLRKTIATITNY